MLGEEIVLDSQQERPGGEVIGVWEVWLGWTGKVGLPQRWEENGTNFDIFSRIAESLGLDGK